ncbi:MAG: chaperone protein DnaJ, molecular chaperone DnaJ [Candidatus Peregrinibacteria bacterium GW2011_GWC2_39_14]|nr:MAG: Chaperone protein DnaJ [Candidatus Peregrinibacteria bacterium GW2011_GWA2_38_36]KKR05238.1 MAG: chaperone protein DnaJ, molecular chaperone DnaJ [Candidatus Peregrinibacteria bacterium GW2011_GWC2_39_14]
MPKDFYETLGVQKSATEQEIKRAYRKMAMKWHPDKHKGDKGAEEKFKEINQAYEVVSDPKKRQTYDQYGSMPGYNPNSTGGTSGTGFGGADGFSQGGFGGGGFDFSGFSGEGFSDIFETFFGGGNRRGRSRKGPRRGSDIEATISITFEEAAFGTEKELEITKIGKCDACNGNGAEPGTPIITCDECNGTGEVRTVRNTILGQIATSKTCDKCQGEGKTPKAPCKRCNGAGRMRVVEHVKIRIPAGVDNGTTIKLSGKGEAGTKGGDFGDLYTTMRVSQSKKFNREGFDINTEKKIGIAQAVLGSEVDIETLYGLIKLKIPAGTQSGKVFRLKEYGVKKLNDNERGDHFVTVIVDIPNKLSKRERELYNELAKETGVKVGDKGWF